MGDCHASFRFCEGFQAAGGGGVEGWTLSSQEKYEAQEVEVRPAGLEGLDSELELVLVAPNQHYGLASPLRGGVLYPAESDEVVVQYEVAFTEGLTCGGSYIKILRAEEGTALSALSNETGYAIMFGPDRCGATDKIHFIIQLRNPLTGVWEEKHLSPAKTTKPPNDTRRHVYTLSIQRNASFKIFVDLREVASGSLLDDLEPSINPPKEIPDREDIKPDDWIDEMRVPDPKAVKPDDWDETVPPRMPDPLATIPVGWLLDEPATIPDPEAKIPHDWDDGEDGEWIPPLVPNPVCSDAPGCGEWKRPTVPNPAFKGKWKPPMIDNPEYRGPWRPRHIPNPDFYEIEAPYEVLPAMSAVAIEVWTINGGLSFDNIVVGTDVTAALSHAELRWGKKSAIEIKSHFSGTDFGSESGIFDGLRSISQEIAKTARGDPVAAAGTAAALVVTLFFILRPLFTKKGLSTNVSVGPECSASRATEEKHHEDLISGTKSEKEGSDEERKEE